MPVWLSTVLALGGSALISAVIGLIVKRVEAKADKKAAANRHYKEAHDAQEDAEKMNEFKGELVHEIKEILNPLEDKVDKLSEQLAEDRVATTTTIRSKMKTLRDQYKEQGYADIGDKATWKELYEHYKKMGGNHFKEYVDEWKKEVEALPLEKLVRVKKTTTKE